MYTLFIDTHDSLITISLVNENDIITKTKESTYAHAVYLMPMIKSMFKENNLTVKDIKNIVAVNGPGSFTGLRIGLSVAKTMAYSLNVPIYLISSLTSYLVSDSTKSIKQAVIEDNKGYYVSVFDKDNNVLIDETYTENLDDYQNYTVKESLDIKSVVDYALKTKAIDAHLVRANYVKKIEVEK